MKKILYIFLTLSILSIGCSKEEDDIQIVQETPSSLDDKLYGIWKDSDETSSNYDWYRSYTSNGKWTSWREDLNGNFEEYEYTGNWWVQDNYLFSDYSNSSTSSVDVFIYNVNGNTLTLDGSPWKKQ